MLPRFLRGNSFLLCCLFLLLLHFLVMPAARLSGGQKRRTALLRALWAASDTLLLDEPFTGMDPDTLAAAAALLRERCGEKPVLLATHDREAIRLLGWPVVELENA